MTSTTTTRLLATIGVLLGVTALAGCASAGQVPDGVDPTSSDQPVVAFYGDSYTLGTGASDPAERWSTRICLDRGWAEFNPSVNGLGFVNNRAGIHDDLISRVIDTDPDIVFVTMGLNDNFSMPGRAAEIEAAISDDLDTLAAELPDARLVVVEPFWYTDERPESVDTIISWVKDAAGGVGADYIAGASRWIEGHPEWMAGDGLHPNDAGYAAMTERMDEELTKLGL
ncbi:lysophospholipase L1-like esterase [Mycetocola sp. CAN_C7]|uniref:SGNH/GDSL hydrolase family protein n=1 Tax=Mycetocola sp. CAN_C7 TaxID=2787724 RepID=UPI001A292BF9